MRIAQFGFSLLELMIVLAIIGILVVVGTPTYKQYITKARFAEIVQMTTLYKTAVALALQQDIPMEELRNGSHGIPDSPKSSKAIESIIVENGVITAKGTALVHDATMMLIPNEEGTKWEIAGTCINLGLCNA